MRKINNKGQTLIEALVALSVSTIIIAAITMAVITGMNNATFSKNQNLATGFAQQGMDILHQQSQSDWATFDGMATNITYCLVQNETTLDSDCPDSPNINSSFVRKVKIEPPSAGCSSGKKVSVTVSWGDGKCTDAGNKYCHNVSLDSCFAQTNTSTNP